MPRPTPNKPPPTEGRRRTRFFQRAAALGLGVVVVVLALGFYRATLESPPPTLLLQDRHGVFLGELNTDERRGHGFWPVQTLPPRVVAATLALEDQRFWSHPGVDPLAVGRAVWQNIHSDAVVSGASTIAMQVARMQSPAPRSYLNKVVEAATALALTLRHGRETVLGQYLRLVPYGNNIHGIGYAARRYLDKPVEDLSWAEIAFLSAIPQSPSRMNPYRAAGRQRAIERGQRILAKLRDQTVITAEEFQLAMRQIDAIHVADRDWRPASAMHAILKMEELLAAPGQQTVRAQAPLITTTLDLALQQRVADITREMLDVWRPQGAGNAAVIVLDLGDGAVRSWVGSGDYFDARYSGAIDYARVKRSSGSTLKPFLYALGLEQGSITAATVLDDIPAPGLPLRNADQHYLGPVLPRQALANSRNLPVAQLVERIGLDTTYAYLRTLDLHQSELPAQHYGLGLAIGGLPVTLEELVHAYTVLAHDGRALPLRWFEKDPAGARPQLLSTATARQVSLFLSDPNARLPSFPRMGTTEYPFPVAVKTGTSQGYRDAWVLAYSGRYLIGVWTGDPDQQPMSQLGGAGSAAALAQRVMLTLHDDQRHGQSDLGFPAPPGYVKVKLCATSGKLAGKHCDRSHEEWLKPEQVPLEEDTNLRRILVDSRNGKPATNATPARFRQTRTVLDLPPRYAAWAAQNGLATLADLRQTAPNPRLAANAPQVTLDILSPRDGAHFIRNPETPSLQASIELSAQVMPAVRQVVWYVDGKPFKTADYPYHVRLPIDQGRHNIYAAVPFTNERSTAVHIEVE